MNGPKNDEPSGARCRIYTGSFRVGNKFLVPLGANSELAMAASRLPSASKSCTVWPERKKTCTV